MGKSHSHAKPIEKCKRSAPVKNKPAARLCTVCLTPLTKTSVKSVTGGTLIRYYCSTCDVYTG